MAGPALATQAINNKALSRTKGRIAIISSTVFQFIPKMRRLQLRRGLRVGVGPDYCGREMRIPEVATLILAVVCAVVSAQARTAQGSRDASASYATDIDATKQWVDTNIDPHAGEKLHITATGTITYPEGPSSKPPAQPFGPDGLARSWEDLIHQYAVADGGHGELIGRLGSGDGGQPFAIGAASDFEAPVANRLF
jgi:hypothetical protein